jgi:hypothetical protein
MGTRGLDEPDRGQAAEAQDSDAEPDGPQGGEHADDERGVPQSSGTAVVAGDEDVLLGSSRAVWLCFPDRHRGRRKDAPTTGGRDSVLG